MKKMSFLKKNNKGMALVTVIVAIGFIAALVSILMLTTLVNFKMKSVNERSKDTFYSAEQAIDEINVGLQHIVSESMSEAYMDIMTNYGSDAYTPEAKTELLTTKYYEALWDRLEYTDLGNGYYDVSILESFLKPTTKWHTPSGVSSDGGYGAIVVAVDDEAVIEADKEKKYGRMITYEKSGVVLKNVKVYYKDQMGFVSVVQTDIRLTYPEFDFADTSELPTIPQYAFVADGGATIEATGDLKLGGNIYANNLEISGGTSDSAKLNVITEADQVITSKYNIDFGNFTNYTGKNGKNATDMDTPVTLRARNVIVNSSDVRLVGKTLLANDLNIKGNNSDVTLVGSFTGYGIGNNMSATNVDLSWNTTNISPDWSSSILINGKNTSLDMSGLDEITLYGHSYIGTGKADVLNSKNHTNDYDNNFSTRLKNNTTYNGEKKYNDIAMGESIAVKTNQMLYLVPASAIGVDNNGKSKYNRNPLTQDEYLELIRDIENGERVLTSSSVVVPELNSDLSEFVKGNSGELNVQTIWARVNDENVGSLVYFYMTFDDEEKANKYYAVRYEGSKEKFDNYTKGYLKDIKWPNTNNMLTFNMAANAMDIDSDGKLERKTSSFISTVSTSDEHKNASIRFLNEFKGMCNRLETKPRLRREESAAGKTEADLYAVPFEDTIEADKSANQIVYENIINGSSMTSFLNDVKAGVDEYEGIQMEESGGVISIVDNNNGGKTVAIIDTNKGTDSDGDGIVDTATTINLSSSINPDVILVITEGNVVVSRDFEGLILANGKVTFKGADLVIKSSPEEVRKALQYGFETSSGDVKTVAYTLADGTQYTYSNAASAGYSADYALGGLITYENWKKD